MTESVDLKNSRINFKSFLWHAIFLALASNFMDIDTVIPAMLIQSGGKPWHLGIMTAILVGGAGFFQLVFSGTISAKSYKKKLLIGGISLRIFALFALSILFFSTQMINPGYIIALIFIFILMFSVSGSFAGVSYIDILGKSVTKQMRKNFFGLKETFASIGIFISAIIVRHLLKELNYPTNYALLFFVAASLLFIASFGFWNIREVPSVIKEPKKNFFKLIQAIPRFLKDDSNLKNYLVIINSLGLGMTLLPFFILFAKDNFELTDKMIGNFLIFRVSGMLFSGLFFYKFSQKINFKKLSVIGSILGTLIPWIGLLMANDPAWYPIIFLFSGFYVSVYKIVKDGILIEISNSDNRSIYTGIGGAGNILPLLFPVFAGIIISKTGYIPVFIIVSMVVLTSIFFSMKLDCSSISSGELLEKTPLNK